MECHSLLPLECVRSGEWAEVESIVGQHDSVLRMAEMGIRSGSRFKVLRQGRPCLLQIGASRLSLRSDTATQILVRPILESA